MFRRLYSHAEDDRLIISVIAQALTGSLNEPDRGHFSSLWVQRVPFVSPHPAMFRLIRLVNLRFI